MAEKNEVPLPGSGILLPYNLEVIEILRDMEHLIRKKYIHEKNSQDLKSLAAKKDIVITIELKDYGRLIKVIKKHNKRKIEGHSLVTVVLIRILGFRGTPKWEKLTEDGVEKWVISQPLYRIKYNCSDSGSGAMNLVIKDHHALPRDFVAGYFGFDTGIDGLNLLLCGGFLIPPDRGAYIELAGESGIGKTSLVMKLITAFLQNPKFKNAYSTKEKTSKKIRIHEQSLSLHYILIEQKRENLIRLIKEGHFIDPLNANVWALAEEELKKTKTKESENYKVNEDVIEKLIDFEEKETFSPMAVLEKINHIEHGEECEDKRKVIVIDSVNAIQDLNPERNEWRELFQSIKSITRERNTIVIFLVEKNPLEPDATVEYLSDVVIKLHRHYAEELFFRKLEFAESRFQQFFTGRHIFYLTNQCTGFIRVYPSGQTMGKLIPHRKRVHPPQTEAREVGIKIDGIYNFFKYTHRYSLKMAPYFLKNTIALFTGDSGSHKSAFARNFAFSAFRDERWEPAYTAGVAPPERIIEFDYRHRNANRPWEELLVLETWNAKPEEKAIPLLLLFYENYLEDPKHDIIWETYFGKVIIPGCKIKEKRVMGFITQIVCLYEAKNIPEGIYLYQLDEFIRSIENCEASDIIPDSYEDFLKPTSISLLNRRFPKEKYKGDILFNPYKKIYESQLEKPFEMSVPERIKMLTQEAGGLNLDLSKTIPTEKNPNIEYNYKGVKKIKVSRILMDDAASLENLYTSLNARVYISTLANLCMAREITLGIVNTRSMEGISEIDTLCSAVADNVFAFYKYFFKGELFTTFSILRSATNCHNNLLYHISKRDDDLLVLNNTFSLLYDVEKQNPEPIEIRLFLPDLPKELSKSMYRILLDRDRLMEFNEQNKNDYSKRINYAFEFKIVGDQLNTFYRPQEQFPSIFKDWHAYLKDTITYSLAHPEVNVFTANDPFTDISIVLDDESAKDAITIICLPGYLMEIYETNLAPLTHFLHFPGKDDTLPVKVTLDDEKRWIEYFHAGGDIKFGNEFYYLHKAPIRIPLKGQDLKASYGNHWIIPQILFNPAISRDEQTNKISINNYPDDHIDIKGYPYFIDPRVNLVFSLENEVGQDKLTEPDYFIHNNAHDFVALLFELWYSKAKCEDGQENCSKKRCNFCFFQQAFDEAPGVEEVAAEFVDLVEKSVAFNKDGLIRNILDLDKNQNQRIVLREWYSSAQQKLKVLEPLLINQGKRIHVKLEIPQYFLYTTWYLALPVNSPRKELASEIIVKMTEPQDLAHLQISGIGLQLSDRFYCEDIPKSYPSYKYNDVKTALESITNKEEGKLGIPISAIHCYYEHLTPLGGMLHDIYRYCKNSVTTEPDRNKRKEAFDTLKNDLFEKIKTFGKQFKNWPKIINRRCSSCYLPHLFCRKYKSNPPTQPGSPVVK